MRSGFAAFLCRHSGRGVHVRHLLFLKPTLVQRESHNLILAHPPQPAAQLQHDRVHGSLGALGNPDALRRGETLAACWTNPAKHDRGACSLTLCRNSNNIMKWSWKAFGLQLVATFVVALGLAYGISMVIDAKRDPGAPDSTLISMAIGGFIAPLILSLIAGWKGWILKSPLIVAFIVAAIYASNPTVGILCVIISAVLYFAARKGGEILAYYAPPKNDVSGPVE
jgi:hypothetical protein